MSTLVAGIVDDAQRLIRQEVELARREMQEELTKAKTAAISFGVAAAVGLLGTIMSCFMIAHFLHWITGPSGMDPAGIPLFGCYAIVMGLFFALAGVLFFMAKNKMSEIDLLPRRTVATMKENVQWLKNQT
jgi:hypothetical protein